MMLHHGNKRLSRLPIIKPQSVLYIYDKSPGTKSEAFSYHAPTHEVVPNAVTIAVAMVAIRCTMNLIVSFVDIVLRI
jgi:hypothetical protein